MRKRRRNLLLAGLVALVFVGWLAWLALPPREPVYHGKTLSEWLQGYEPPGGGTYDANEAVRHIGTNAIPTLLRMLRAKDSRLKTACAQLLNRQHFVKVTITPAVTRNYEAWMAFSALGADAANAVPELVTIYDDQISGPSKAATAGSIGSIGPAAKSAIPSLIRGLKTTNNLVREYTVGAISGINSEPKLVVPELVKLLHDPNPRVRVYVISALRNFGTNAEAAVPTLIGILDDQNPSIREPAANLLKQIDPEAAAKAGVK